MDGGSKIGEMSVQSKMIVYLSRIIAKIGIPSDEYQKDWKPRLRRERYNFFTNFRSGTLVRSQVTVENCV